MSNRTTTKLLVLIASGLVLNACTGNGNSMEKKGNVEVTTVDENSEDQDFVLPQPISLAHAFKNAGLAYIPGKTNALSSKENYNRKIDQLLNLGVYSTDLAYCAINNKTQEARDYLSAVQYLGGKVGLESIFSDKTIIEKFDKNLGNPGALEDLIYDIQDRSDAFFEENDMSGLAAVEFAGAWIEGMYLGSDPEAHSKLDVNLALVEQMNLLKNTIKGLKSQDSGDPRLNEVIKNYESVLTTYEDFETVKKASKNVNFEVPELTPEEFSKLASKIASVRNNIVAPVKK